MDTPISLFRGDSHGIETDYRDLLPVNIYPVMKQILGASGYMTAYPGLSEFAAGEGVDRAGVYNDRLSDHYRVSGESLISVSALGVASVIGDVPGSGQASMPYSFNTQCIISDGNMFFYDADSGFRQVTDTDLGIPIDGVWIDGYYFLTDGEYIYHTDIDDESSIDPLKFATAEFMPDKSLGLSKTQDNKVIVWGRYSMEYFINAANDDFAFQRVATRAQKIGIVSTHSKTEVAGTFFILGGRKNESVSVYAVSTGSALKVATREIDKIIETYSEPELSDVRVESRVEKDCTFVTIHLPDETLCYLPSTGAWVILKSGIYGTEKHRAINSIFDPRIGAWVCGDTSDGTIGEIDHSVFTQYDDDPQEWLLYTPFIKLDGQSFDKIEIETLPGFNDEGDASVRLSMTYDGVSWGREIKIDYGEPLGYGSRFISRRLGYVPNWFGLKLRGATRSKMTFGLLKITHG